jgi:hypothetical protein
MPTAALPAAVRKSGETAKSGPLAGSVRNGAVLDGEIEGDKFIVNK